MSTKKMLIDTTHPEETRVVVLSGNLLEDFDVEVESRRQLKGNIYLAKVIRVEPSLQAAFVDYGGNRHGFLAFNEIHPDYYQIPVADREALVAEHEAAEQADEESAQEVGVPQAGEVETVGGDDSEELEVRRARPSLRSYKIQEVIKRRQVLLVQVVKEERGNKGAALTTYLSLAGRYCVLMPNTARGGGISRKISNGPERKKLKTMLGELDIPKGMAVIVRTAGSKRSRTEIKRDYEYLIRLWDTIREMTLKSTAPALIHEEGNLIKRTLRDLYNNEIEEIIVDGEEGYRAAKNFMKLMIPSHAKKVKQYDDASMPMLQRFQVESQLDAIHSPVVQMKSGAYIVINPTEALVSIDVNSGRSTKERNIEETALKTNLEAVGEIARQVRLRDLSGLLVIDFIDMENARNNTKVERRLKDAMRNDRARIQLGRISPFGLLEFSRQRMRPSLIETSSGPCPYCDGSGVRRSTDSAALFVLRAIEEEATKKCAEEIIVHTAPEVVLYIINHKRASLADIESRNDISVRLANDDSLVPPECRIERVKLRPGVAPEKIKESGGEVKKMDGEEGSKRRRRRPRRRKRSSEDHDAMAAGASQNKDAEIIAKEGEKAVPEAEGGGGEPTTGKRRRRGRRGGRRRARKPSDAVMAEAAPIVEGVPAPDSLLEGPADPALLESPPETVMVVSPDGVIDSEVKEQPAEKKPAKRKNAAKGSPKKRTKKTEDAPKDASGDASGAASETAKEDDKEKPKPVRRRRKTAKENDGEKKATARRRETSSSDAAKNTVINVGEAPPAPVEEKPKKGWWQRP